MNDTLNLDLKCGLASCTFQVVLDSDLSLVCCLRRCGWWWLGLKIPPEWSREATSRSPLLPSQLPRWEDELDGGGLVQAWGPQRHSRPVYGEAQS